jgi:hypothetical protein
MKIEDLKKFCENDRYRPYLSNPFSLGDFTYATDGKVAVRVPRLEGIGEVEDAPASIETTFANNLKGFEQAAPVPNPPHVTNIICKACKGRQKVTICSECEGEGYRECDLGHEHDCEDCDGNGVIGDRSGESAVECPECEGVGRLPNLPQGLSTGVIVNDKTCVGLRYLRRIATLPAVKWSLNHRKESSETIPFWFDGGEGILMPMRFWEPGGGNYLRVDEERAA